MFLRRHSRASREPRTIEMLLDHDGQNWSVSDAHISVSAASLKELDRKLEEALRPRLSKEKKLKVFMTSNNEMIPEWMRPFMSHYFNRLLELPLRY